MAGLYPGDGVAASTTQNGVDVPTTGCTDGELFYSTSVCKPTLNASAMNAMMSEILNLVNCSGATYDCGVLNNLCTAVTAMIAAADSNVNAVTLNFNPLTGELTASVGEDGATVTSAAIIIPTQPFLAAGTNITVTGTGTAADPFVVSAGPADDDITANFVGFDPNTRTLTSTVTEGGVVQAATVIVPVATLNAGAGTTVTGTGTPADPFIVNATGGNINAGTNVTVTGTGTAADPFVINSTLADVNAGTNVTITGTGTAADPYVVNSVLADVNAGNGVTITGAGTAAAPYVVSVVTACSGATAATAAEIAAYNGATDTVLMCIGGNLRSVPAGTINTDTNTFGAARDALAADVGNDVFGNAIALGDDIIALPNGDLVRVGPVAAGGANAVGRDALAADVGNDIFGNAIALGDDILVLANGDLVRIGPAAAGAGVAFGAPATVITRVGNTGAADGLAAIIPADAVNDRLVRITGSNVNDTIHVGGGAAVVGAPPGFTPLAGTTTTHVTGREDGTRVVWGTLAAGSSFSTRVNDTTGNGVGTISVELWNA